MKRWFDIITNIAFVCICLFLLWILALVFVFASFRIPSESMSPELREGDYILVWKPIVGARLFNLSRLLNHEQTGIYRLPGFRKIKRNDVVVFNFPYPNDRSRIEMHIMKYYIKRCIGLPGDTVSISNGMFKIKGVDIPLGNITSQKRIGLMRSEDLPEMVYKCFPYDSLIDWNIKEFGPLFVPSEGDIVKMDRIGGVLYRKLIEWEQEKKMNVKGDTVLLNDSVITSYQFRKNYYFVAGDHGENSQDSRYWGLLPEEYIVGVASRIWKSEDSYTGDICWDRVWKKIE
ncbi:MAG: signal peptidase I [Phocaeicola sp.]|nr:signal peptidase I [Phocaeicola sp.]